MHHTLLARTLCAELATLTPGEPVRLDGWVHRRRTLAAVTFLILRDRTGLAQIVLKDPDVINAITAIPEETCVRIDGIATANPAAPGGIEVTSPQIIALTEPALTPPVELWRPSLAASLPMLLDHAPVLWRHPEQRGYWEIAAAALTGFRSTLDGDGFTEVVTPKLVASATESGANVFAVDYFGRQAYLAQSPQFHKQMLVGVFERLFEVGPVFRAEPHDTVRHLAQYTSLDVELGFIADHHDVLAVLRDVLAGMVTSVAERAGTALTKLAVDLPVIPERIPVIHFRDALAMVGAPADEPDLAPAHERAIGEWALADRGSDVVAVEGYPMAKRPFYTHPQPDEPRWSRSFDLLFRGMELVTGGQRLHRHSDYVAALTARGEDTSPQGPYGDYLATFAHGMPPHGGFAIGLERFVGRLTRAENIRTGTLFPRDLHRLAP